MDFTATIKFLRTSPRKLRLVGRSLKGQEVAKSLIFLSQINKRAAKTLFKAVKSATANAKSKGLEEKDLKIKNVIIEGGPVYKRFQPVSRGQAHPITKRTSHIKIILEGGQGESRESREQRGKREQGGKTPDTLHTLDTPDSLK